MLYEVITASLGRLCHDFLDTGDVAGQNQIRDQRRVDHYLNGRYPTLAALSRYQPLRDDGLEVKRQVHEQL